MADEEWITAKEAARILKTSDRNVLTKIYQKRLWARRDGKRWLVHRSLSPPPEAQNGVGAETVQHLKETVERLTDENAYLREELKTERGRSEQARERSDTIILQLTRQLEQSQRLLEYQGSSWWRRWRQRRQRDQE